MELSSITTTAFVPSWEVLSTLNVQQTVASLWVLTVTVPPLIPTTAA